MIGNHAAPRLHDCMPSMNRHANDSDDRSISFDEVDGLPFDVTSPSELHVFADSDRWDYAHHFRGDRNGRVPSSEALGIGNLLLDNSQSESMLSNADNDPLGWASQVAVNVSQDKPFKLPLVSCLKKRQDSILSTTSSGASSIISCAEAPSRESSGHDREGESTASLAASEVTITELSSFKLQTKLECDIDSTLQYSLNSSAVPPKNPQRCESLGLTARSPAVDPSRFDGAAGNADESSYRDNSKRHVRFSARLSSTRSIGSRVE